MDDDDLLDRDVAFGQVGLRLHELQAIIDTFFRLLAFFSALVRVRTGHFSDGGRRAVLASTTAKLVSATSHDVLLRADLQHLRTMPVLYALVRTFVLLLCCTASASDVDVAATE